MYTVGVHADHEQIVLDDNTYTNKTWAEVSGISVMEVHIMEVEFLSNMKYALFTSAEEWGTWQTQLGRFASFFERATSRASVSGPSGLALPFPPMGHTLPSPPTSNQASPPYAGSNTPIQGTYSHAVAVQTHGPTPNPSPLGPLPDLSSQRTRKRSLDNDYSTEPPAKRVATSNTPYGHLQNAHPASNAPTQSGSQYVSRVTLPSLAIPQSQISQSSQSTAAQQQLPPQLPPLNYGHRAIGVNQLPPATWTQTPTIPASSTHFASTPIQMPPIPQSLPQSRHQSPFSASSGVSPTNAALQPALAQLSPSLFLAQRNSPYRPIRGVSTLLVPPPPRAMHQPQTFDREQMHYQPLGRPQERQQGRLPYIHQNQWYDGQQQPNSQSNQWANYSMQTHQQHPTLPNPAYGRI